MSVDGALWVVRRVLYAFDFGCFPSLLGLSQLLNAFLRRVFDIRKALHISGLSGAVGAHLAWVIPKFVKPGFVISYCSICHLYFLRLHKFALMICALTFDADGFEEVA
jgi:hypothetical protein